MGMFVKNEARMEEAKTIREEKHSQIMVQCRVIFADLDAEGSGEISTDIVTDNLGRIARMLIALKIEFSEIDLHEIVRLMDKDHNGGISESEFIHAVLFQAEGVRPMSMQEMHYDVCACKSKLDRLTALCESSL